jgi:hypothetical protein|eukprot:SAG25_NODE_1585_length_2729_cov_1.626236_6_plen_65_part_00
MMAVVVVTTTRSTIAWECSRSYSTRALLCRAADSCTEYPQQRTSTDVGCVGMAGWGRKGGTISQ